MMANPGDTRTGRPRSRLGGGHAPSSSRRGTAARPGLRRRHSDRHTVSGVAFVSPFIVVFGVFSIWPDIYSLLLSFERYAGYGPTQHVGLANYRALFAYSSFWAEVTNTLFYWAAHAVIVIPLAFVTAIVVRSKLVKGKALWKPLIFLPQVMSVVAVSLVWQTLFSTQYGVVNSVFGLHIQWLSDFAIARWIVVLLLVWQGLGFWFVIFLSGLTAVDPAIIEAATIDGAGTVRRTVSVVVPLMRPVILFAVVIDAIGSMSLYTQPNVLLATGGGLANPSVSTLSNLEVGNLQAGVFGQSAAAGWLLFVLTIMVTAVVFGGNRLLGRSPGRRGRLRRPDRPPRSGPWHLRRRQGQRPDWVGAQGTGGGRDA
jgi:ABC-type sugar transport system permease subunit